ncbi:MAG TPA: UDP-N-acetylglucosamine 2-epimerase (non-hydrolyzing) [Acidimicrobiia bacterium]|nr:UDP-N-acetylglucosamine 2-epimerase (non-hydrolyzing) [Acidimicrobiia bacterium]
MANQYGLPPGSIGVLLGTRPEIIKLAHIITLLDDAAFLVHTAQHYDPTLSEIFFADLSLPPPAAFLGVGGESRGRQIALTLERLEGVLTGHRLQALIVQGDTNSAAAGALAANTNGIFLTHIEAGLRSHDRQMPEEHNRIIADHLADLCCAPTELAVANLTGEGIPASRVTLTGNTIVEAVGSLLPAREERVELLLKYDLSPGEYVLATFHRPENVDDPARFRMILEQLAGLSRSVLYPIHPRAAASADRHRLGGLLAKLAVTEPLGYRQFLALLAEAALVVSDSGGIAEEASIVKRPLLMVRRSTERPEVLGTFATRVEAGPAIGGEARRMLELGWDHLQDIPSPFGDGSASRRSLEALLDRLA